MLLGSALYTELVQTNGTVNHTRAQVGISGHHGVYRMSGGTVKATGDFEVGPNGVGEFLQTGGSVTLQNWFNIGRYKNGNGTYTITGGSLLVNKASNGGADKVYVGNASNSSGTLNVGGSGQVEFKCHLALGSQLDGNGGKGYANVYGNGNLLTTGNIWIGHTGGETGEFRQTGGIAQCNGTTLVCSEDASSGLLDISGTGEYRAAGGMTVGANGTLNVHDGGRLVAKSISTSKSTAKATFDGGTVVLTNITDGASLFGGFSSITVGAGGLTLDTAGYNVTMATASGAKVAATAGSTFTKTGSGTLTVAAVPPVGNMVVSSGTLALSTSCDNTAPVGIAHRWSFNGEGNDYTDSITGASASTFGNDATKRATTGGKLVLRGNGSGQGSLNLGKNLLGSGDATVEIWASNDAAKHYARVFDYGNGSYASNPWQTDCFLFIWSTGTDATKDVVQLKKNNTAVINKTGTMSVMDLGKQYYFAFTFKANGDGSTTIKWMRRNAVTGELERSEEETVSDWTLANLVDKNSDFWLGVSKYSGDSDANASYDEVRIWNGALTADALALSAMKGPDATSADLAEISGCTLTLESGATLSLGEGNTLVQPVVSGGGTVSGGTLKVANELLVTDLDDSLIVDGGTFDIDGAKVVFSAAALQALAATGRTYTLVSAVNGGTITGSPLQTTDLPPGWRVKTTSSSVILRKDGMSIHIR